MYKVQSEIFPVTQRMAYQHRELTPHTCAPSETDEKKKKEKNTSHNCQMTSDNAAI